MSLAALAVATLVACSAPVERELATPEPPPPAPVDLIAYIGNDGNVFTIRGDGTLREQLTRINSGPVASLAAAGLAQARSSSYYAWPTWSPDGERLAASRVVSEGSPHDGVDLRVIDRSSGIETVVFANNPPTSGWSRRERRITPTGAPMACTWVSCVRRVRTHVVHGKRERRRRCGGSHFRRTVVFCMVAHR